LTVDIPIVCETEAAGLGTLGLVICADVMTEVASVNTIAISLSIDFKFWCEKLNQS